MNKISLAMKYKFLIPLFVGVLASFVNPSQAFLAQRSDLIIFKKGVLELRPIGYGIYAERDCRYLSNRLKQGLKLKTPDTAFCLIYRLDSEQKTRYTLYVKSPRSNVLNIGVDVGGLSACKNAGARLKWELTILTTYTDWTTACIKE